MINKCVVIGLGGIGMAYDYELLDEEKILTHSKALKLHPNFDLVASVDLDSFKRENFKSKYSCPVYKDIDTLLSENLSIDIAIIATPTEFHFDNIKKIINIKGLKIILCEKPLSSSHEDSQKIVKFCNENNIRLFVNYIRKSDISTKIIYDKIQSSEFETPIKGTVWYTKGFLHSGTHFLNLLQYWLGNVTHFNVINKGKQINNYDSEPDVHLSFEKGEILFLSLLESNYSHHSMELYASNGRLKYDQAGYVIEWQSIVEDINFPTYKVINSEITQIKNDLIRYQWNVYCEIVKFMNNQDHCLCTAEEALVMQKTVNEIFNSRSSN
jgi:hypothetical protein